MWWPVSSRRSCWRWGLCCCDSGWYRGRDEEVRIAIRKRRVLGIADIVLIAVATASLAGVWLVGNVLIHPAPADIGSPPPDFPARAEIFNSASGSFIHGWFAAGEGHEAVLLLHGVRTNRLRMLDRARFLQAAGYSVLMIDFQGSGESSGGAITFGHLESMDAAAALVELRKLAPGERVGIVGTSMSNASEPALFAATLQVVDALIAKAAAEKNKTAAPPAQARKK